MIWQMNDGGRSAAGYSGKTGDCVVRSIAIATGLPYQQIYDAVNEAGTQERTGKRKRGKSNARTGVYKTTIRKFMDGLGWKETPRLPRTRKRIRQPRRNRPSGGGSELWP